MGRKHKKVVETPEVEDEIPAVEDSAPIVDESDDGSTETEADNFGLDSGGDEDYSDVGDDD